MKNIFTAIVVSFGLTLSTWAADTTVKISDVHLCCQNCVKGVQTAVDKVQGVTASADQDTETISLTAADTATVQKAVDTLVAAGYFGKSSDAAIKVNADTGAKGQKVQSLQLDGVHLCCGQCVKSVNRALSSVSGVTTNTAVKNAKSFTVSGDFNDKDVADALQKEGLTGKVAK